MIKRDLIILLMILFASSCDNRHITMIAEEIALPESDVITHTPFNIDVMGSNDILVFDSLLFVISSNPEGQLSIFSTNNKKMLVNLCKSGRAKGEFLQPFSPTKQIYTKGNSVLMPLVNNAIQLKVINITESIKKGITEIEFQENCPFISDGNVFIGTTESERIITWNTTSEDPFSGPYHAPKIEYKKHDKVFKTCKFFPKLMQTESDGMIIDLYNCTSRICPNGNLLVQAFYRMGYIFIVDYKTGESKAIHLAGTPTFDDYFTKNNLPGRYFGDVAVTNDYIIALYLGGRALTELPQPHVLIFDWDGNLLSSALLEKGIQAHSIAYDELHNSLYVVDIMKDEFYIINMKELICEN